MQPSDIVPIQSGTYFNITFPNTWSLPNITTDQPCISVNNFCLSNIIIYQL